MRAAVPEAAVDEDSDTPTRIGDIGTTWGPLPVDAVSREPAARNKARTVSSGPGVLLTIATHAFRDRPR